MRSLFAKSIIALFVMLSLGTGLAWASTSSKPGMFLYPLKKATQKAVQVLKDIPAIEIRLTAATSPPVATDSGQVDEPTPEPTFTTTATATSTAAATRAPTPVKAADKITPTATATADQIADVSTITPSPDPPAQTLGAVSSVVSDDQSSQRNSESSHDDSDKSDKSSDDAGEHDSGDHSSEDSSGEHE